MISLTAIDILVEPDGAALACAAAENARLRTKYPAGFELDESHRPHITLLQRYVRSEDLEAVFASVERVIRSRDAEKLSFRAEGIRHMPVAAMPGLGLAAIVLKPGVEVLALQGALIDAVGPFTRRGGTAAAFEITPQEPEISTDTLAYVERYVPEHSGPNFVAHLTVGLGPLDYLDAIEAEPFEGATFYPSAIAVFRLGNNGTARRQLIAWPSSS